MEEANSEDKRTPVGVINLINEFLSNNGGESLIETSLETLRRFIGDLECLLKETKREFRMLFTSNPETEIFVDLIDGTNQSFNFFHELETKMAILKDNPTTFNETLKDDLTSNSFLSFTHRYLFTREFLLLLSKFINR